REQGDIFCRIELDQRERVLQVCKPLLRRYVSAAKALAPPFSDRVQRCVLQELQATPLCPGVRRLAQPGMKFLDQAGFTYSGLANNQHQLPLASTRALPASNQHGNLFLATDQGREMALPRAASAAACPNDPVQRHWLRHAFEFVTAALLGDKQAGDLTLDA